jgi:hypothetical protein
MSRVVKEFYQDSTMVRYGVIALGASAEWLARTLQHVDPSRSVKYLPISGLTNMPKDVEGLLRKHFRECLGQLSKEYVDAQGNKVKTVWLVVDVVGDTGNTMVNAVKVLELEYPGVTFKKGLFRSGPVLDDVVDLARTPGDDVNKVRQGLLQSEFKRLDIRMFKKIDVQTMASTKALIPVELDEAGVRACGGLVAQIWKQLRTDKYDEAQDKIYKDKVEALKGKMEAAAIQEALRTQSVSQADSCEWGSDAGSTGSRCSWILE